MASRTCWNCGKVAHMTPIAGSAATTKGLLFVEVMGCFQCDNCRAPSIAKASGLQGNQDSLAWLARKKTKEWLPQSPHVVPVKVFPDVPAAIAATASEAYRCRQVCNANRAAIILARSVIEATAKDKGIITGSLIKKIDQLYDQRLIRPDIRDGAHEIRQFGNDIAHGVFVQEASPEEADLVLALMDAVLTDVYQSPAQVARAKAAREQRQVANRALPAAAAQKKQLAPNPPPDVQAAPVQLQNTKLAWPPWDQQAQARESP
jgi:hypothetical protein